MTLTVIFGVATAAFIAISVWSIYDECPTLMVGIMGTIVIGSMLIINLITWIPSKGNSEINYQQLVAERLSIEAILQNDQMVDRMQLNDRVIDYNNRVRFVRENSLREILCEYYSTDVDWGALELIEWEPTIVCPGPSGCSCSSHPR